ncbi:O-antigen ligase family protein [Sphingobium sp. JS3065]|uniref:O-antigen ligase family protein n=1 Tax=Sphingobium sp. JS3065 TaxID=2970925 RepID=UPI002264A115|nr:O-antigen ligase family protein [Sphingobium sp. JS3065]UZW56613.1 O-antigen ligase family protein [Sphingobium sp. JS3065]
MAISASAKRTLPFGALVVPLMIARPSLDNLFGMVRLPVGGASLSPGFLFNIFMVLVAAALAGHALLVNRAQQRSVLAVACVWGPFLLASAMAASYSPVPVDALQTLFNFLTYSAVAFLGLIYGPGLGRSGLTIVVALSGVVPVFFGLGQVAFGTAGDRLASTFDHPNILAFFCLLYISFLFHAQLNGYVRNRAAGAVIWGLIGSAFVALLFTGTRSAYVTVFLFLLCYSALRKPLLVLPLLLLPPLALLIPAVSDRVADALAGSSPVSYDYFVSTMRGDVSDSGALILDSGTWRRYLWQAAWPWIEQRPLFGYGLASFQSYSRSFFPLSSEEGNPAHNVYIQLLFEGGYILLCAYILMYAQIIAKLVSNIKYAKYDVIYCAIVILSFLITAMFDNMIFYLSINVLFWFIIFSLIGLGHRSEQD